MLDSVRYCQIWLRYFIPTDQSTKKILIEVAKVLIHIYKCLEGKGTSALVEKNFG